jgi:hypothetical protein
MGANDGAQLLQFADAPYRDHRPSVQLAAALFLPADAYGEGPWNAALDWLEIARPCGSIAPATSNEGRDGGFAVLRADRAVAVLRYPRFRFRPSQSDLMHLDLWVDGANVLRDAGTFGYNVERHWMDYFGGAAAHNTVQFDGRDQMTKLGRFLWGDWPKSDITRSLEGGEAPAFGVRYADSRGARHERQVRLTSGELRVEDRVSGFSEKAVLRWRLAPGPWRLEAERLTDGRTTLLVSSSTEISRRELVQGSESRHYLERTPLPVLEIEIREAGVLTTHVRWSR